MRRTRRMNLAGRSVIAVVLVIVAAACSGGGVIDAPAPSSTLAAHARPAPVQIPPAAGFLSVKSGQAVHALSVWSWNGRRVATVHTKAVAQCCGVDSLSPDGTRLLVSDSGPGATPHAQVLDLHGRALAGVTGLVNATWADDSRHLCDLRPHQLHQNFPEGPADLVLVDPGHGERVVAQVPGYGPHQGPAVLRCSVTGDDAVVADNVMGMNTSVTDVRLSTGRTSTPKWVRPPDTTDVVAVSGNGRYALEDGANATGVDSVIVDTRSGATVAHVDGQPEGISWNGHLVVALNQGSVLVVVDWRTRTDRWQSAPPPGSGPVASPSAAVSARPGSDDLALAVSEDPGYDPSRAVLFLVTPSTRPRLLDRAFAVGII